jgi:hypothetical protein
MERIADTPGQSGERGFRKAESRASGAHRAGRVLRIYTVEDYQLRPEHDTPEILRSDTPRTFAERLSALAILAKRSPSMDVCAENQAARKLLVCSADGRV